MDDCLSIVTALKGMCSAYENKKGLKMLAECLMRNMQNGFRYHRNNGLKGGFDLLQSEQEVISLLKNGRIAL